MSELLARSNLNGWLISPHGQWCYRFHRDSGVLDCHGYVFVDKWSAMPRRLPSALIKRSKLPFDEALEMCGDLLLAGWNKLETQFWDD